MPTTSINNMLFSTPLSEPLIKDTNPSLKSEVAAGAAVATLISARDLAVRTIFLKNRSVFSRLFRFFNILNMFICCFEYNFIGSFYIFINFIQTIVVRRRR